MNVFQKVLDFLNKKKRERYWRSLFTVMAALVVFVTTYALILPAITMEEETAREDPGIVLDAETMSASVPDDGLFDSQDPEEEPAVPDPEPEPQTSAAPPVEVPTEGQADPPSEVPTEPPTEPPTAAQEPEEQMMQPDAEDTAENASDPVIVIDEDPEDSQPEAGIEITETEAATEKTTETETEAESETAVQAALQTFVWHEAGIKVTVELDEETREYPENTELIMKEIRKEKEKDLYEACIKQLQEWEEQQHLEETDEPLIFRLVFETDGQEIEIDRSAKVEIEFDSPAEWKDWQILKILACFDEVPEKKPLAPEINLHTENEKLKGCRFHVDSLVCDAFILNYLQEEETETEELTEELTEDGTEKIAEELTEEGTEEIEEEFTEEETEEITEEAAPASQLQGPMLFEESSGDVTVTVSTPAGTFPSGVTMSVKPVEPENVADAVADAVGNTIENMLALDITFTDTEGNEVEPACPVSVKIRSSLIEEAPAPVIVHVDDDGEASVVENTKQLSEDEMTFRTAQFSVYVIVDADEPVSYGDAATKVADLNTERGREGFYLSATRGTQDEYYLKSVLKESGALDFTTTINDAAVWYFEPVEGADDQFRICTGTGSSKKYIAQDGTGNNLKWSDEGSVFTVSESGPDGRFNIKLTSANKYLQYSNGGVGFRLFDGNKDTGNCRFKLTYASSEDAGDDPYGLNGKTYGIMNRRNDTSAYGMMAEEKGSSGRLNPKNMLIRSDPMDQSRILYVAKDSDLSMWTFESIEKDIYYMKAEGKYLRIEGNRVTLADEPDEYCRIRVIPGTGSNAGKVRLLGVKSGTAVNLPGNNSGFGADSESASSNGWQNFADYSVYDDSDFVEYFAHKVSVSDSINVANGKQVIIYTRVWNETEKKYEFYAVDHNGDLVPCYESGDSIVWIGAQNNTLLWDFTEYYTPGTTTPSGYYELQNSYTGQYLAPQITGGQVFSDEVIGINLNGRRYGDYYTPIVAWDDAHYDYAGFKTENGKIVSCPMSQADTFYFAVMDLSEGTLTPVQTVDHVAHGISMKIVDFNGNSWQNSVLGSSAGGSGTTLHQGLLNSNIAGDPSGYPLTQTGESLGTLYAQATPVNHLFIQSIYDGSGYYQFDSSENFAHLNGSEFEVYQELGTVKGSGNTRLHGQFMPFNTLDPSKVNIDNPSNLTDIYGKERSDNDPRKYEPLYGFQEPDNSYFGVELTGHFVQPPNGHDAWGHDIIFEFVGDDDFWLYVDGELIIDLGGIHSAAGASVNYSTGKAVINGQNTTLYDLFRKNYASRNNLSIDDPQVKEYVDGIFEAKQVGGETHYVFKDYSAHTVRLFYMERGAGASNLRMRFNLATVTPGEVLLSKKITGTDKQDFASVRFPFQVYCQTEEDGEYVPLNREMTGGINPRWRVTYQNTSNPVEYEESATIDGVEYNNVFYLKPGQTASIMTPDNTLSYYIKECGVDTTIYNKVTANDQPLEGIAPDGATVTRCFETDKETVENRARVTFGNQVDPSQLRTLTITKRLFDGQGEELSASEDSTGFSMRLFLGEELGYYNQGDYYVKDPSGNYCRFDPSAGTFVSVGVTDFASLTQQQLAEVTFTTSPNGAASKLPAGYSIEVRDLLVGTAFKVLEEDYEIPVGYGRRIWEETSLDGTTTTYEGYKRVEGSYLVSEGDTQNSGVIRDNSNPKVEVHNQRGWGIRAEKSWSDSDFMRAHDDTFFAVYVGDELLDGTVRRIDAYNYTTYFFPALEEGARFADYQVCEVKPENPVVDEDGTVSSYDSITRLAAGEEIVLGGTDKDGQTLENLHYSVSYSQGTESPLPGDEGVVRTDRVTNTRTGGLRIVKTDWEGNALACAEFELKKGEEVKDTFTSDMNGVLTTAYPEDGEYTLTETKAPKAYQGLETAVEITVSEGNYSITSDAENGVIYDEETNTLTLKNKPFTLKAVKRDTEGTLLPGAHFALYKQVPVSGGGVRKDYYPISGYEDLESGADGVVDKINESLNPGTYYLSEITAPEGYGLPQEDLCFTIGNDGRVTINTEDDSTWLDTVKEDDRIEYTIGIINIKLTDVTARKEWYTERNKIQDDQANKNVPEGAWSELTLFAEGSDTAIRTIRLDGTIDDKGETAKWEATFADVPSTDSSGNTIRYLIKETAYSETIGSTHFYAVRKETVDGGAIRNAVMFGNINLYKQFEIQPQININSVVSNLKFRITGPYGYSEEIYFSGNAYNQQKHISNLPAGTYTIEEIGYEDLLPGYHWDPEGSSVTANREGSVVDGAMKITFEVATHGQSNDAVDVRFRNNYLPGTAVKGSLKIIKTDQAGQALEQAVFNLSGGALNLEGLVSTIPSDGSEAIIFHDEIEPGTYTLTETKAPDGYYPADGPVTINVTRESNGINVTAEIGGQRIDPPELIRDTATGEWTLRIKNHTGYVLPAAGGTGTFKYVLCGLLLMVVSAFFLAFKGIELYTK